MSDYSKAAEADIEFPEINSIMTFPAKGYSPVIEWKFPEFQSLCPVSGRPDQGVIIMRYKPKEKILESKSIRDYLMMWRNKRNWQEYISEEMAGLFYKSCEPEWLTVTIDWSPRGGIFAKTISERGNLFS